MLFYNILRILLYEKSKVKDMGSHVLKRNGIVIKYLLALQNRVVLW